MTLRRVALPLGLLTFFPVSIFAQSATPLPPPASAQPSGGAKLADAAPVPKIAPLKVAFTLTVQGEATDIRIVTSSGNPKLDQKCMAALAHTRLQPRLVNGVPVTSEEIYLINPTVKS